MEGKGRLRGSVERLLRSLPLKSRLGNWLGGRRFLLAHPAARSEKLVIVAHSVRDSEVASEILVAWEKDWFETPAACRKDYEDILAGMPEVVVVQLRRDNICGCLGHRHLRVHERTFRHLNGFTPSGVGEVDIAHGRIADWEPWPLMNTAFDSRLLPGSRLEEFRQRQFRLRLLSVMLHETNHLVRTREPETSVHARSVNFYREALASYFESSSDTLSFTLDRSFSRLR